jgi:translocation and assembly module TamB
MANDRILLEKMEANDGEQGKVSAKGRIDLDQAKGFPLEMELQLNNGTLIRRDDLSATADGTLTFSGNKDLASLFGRLTIGPAELRIPERLPPEVPDLKVTEINSSVQKVTTEEKQAKGKKTDINLDLNLDFPGRTFVRGRGLDSEWQGKLHISGTTDKPLITGSLSIVRGRYEFLGKPFSLAKGLLSLTGSNPPSPIFDITAEHKQSDFITRLGVTGNPSSLNIELTSEPSLPSDEILSRLLFGRSAANITPFQALRLASALKTLSEGGGGGMFDFMDKTRQVIGLDQLSLQQTEDKGSTPSVSAGKYLNENVYLQVEKGLSSEGDKVSVEVQVTPNISVESEAGRDGQSGIGLNWEWTY